MPYIITFSNQKGGVGKTTLTRELGMYLASPPADFSKNRQASKVLLIDADPQGNLTKGLTDEEHPGTYEVFCGDPAYFHQLRDNLYLLHGSNSLTLLERNLIGEVDAYIRLQKILSWAQFKDFDYILIDTPPSFGVMTLNALAASDFLGIVIHPAIYSLQGTNSLMETFTKVKESINPQLSLLGAFVNAVDERLIITREIMAELHEYFGTHLVVPGLSRSVKIEEAIPQQRGVIEMGKSKVADEIAAIGNECIKRVLSHA
jgi:chromosome partitioning protein